MPSKREILDQVPLLAQLPASLRDALHEAMIERSFSRGETVFLQGQPAQGLIVIWRGQVKVYKVSEGGREQILELEGPGRSIAELPLFDGKPYPASCSALEETILLVLPTSEFHRFLENAPALSRAVIAVLSSRLRHMVALVEEISLKAVRQRLAGLLLELAGEEDRVELVWNHQQLAARIGTVREIVSRTLSRMALEGAIEIDGRTLRLIDRSRL